MAQNEKHGVTKYTKIKPGKGACFIMPQGLFLYGKGLSQAELLEAAGVPGEVDSVVKERGWIRCDSGLHAGWNNAPSPFVELPDSEITEKQRESLRLWLSTCVSGDYVEMIFSDGDCIYCDLGETGASEILEAIRRHYERSSLKEGIKDDEKQVFKTASYRQSDGELYIDAEGMVSKGPGEKYAMLKRMSEGDVRLAPGASGCSIMKKPTAAQYATLARIISRNVKEGFYVDFIDERGDNTDREEFRFPRAVSMISTIKNHFSGKNTIEASKKRIEDLLCMPYEKALDETARLIARRLEENGLYIEITGLDFTGSRRFGDPRDDSDLDVRLTYESIGRRGREDDVFNCLNDEEDPLYLEGYRLDVNPAENGDIEDLIKRDSKFRKASESLTEETRNGLIAKSRSAGSYKDQSRGKNRFERRRYSKIANAVRSYNQIDMNDFFKKDILTVKVPVAGETGDYMVSIKLEGVCAEIVKNVKNNKNKFEFRTVIQALTKVFNTGNVYVNCTCDDFRYTFAHWSIVNGYSTEDTAHDPGPGKNIRNPQADKGIGCKHVLLVLSNADWLMKTASVINNYIHYAEKNMSKAFLKLIFPKIYGIPADEMVEQDLIDDDKYLESSPGVIDAINEYGKNRGKYVKGTNKNPVTGTGGRSKKEAEEQEEASTD